MKKIAFSLLMLVLLTSCASMRTKTYEFPTFSMQYPASWKTMVELSPEYKPARDYMWLHISEDFTLTSAKKEGDPGLYLMVSARAHGDNLTFSYWTYATVEEYTHNLNQVPVTVGGVEGVMYHYDREWEGKWYQMRDYWLTYQMLSYTLSFRAENLDDYNQEIDLILDSFTFKEWDPFAKN